MRQWLFRHAAELAWKKLWPLFFIAAALTIGKIQFRKKKQRERERERNERIAQAVFDKLNEQRQRGPSTQKKRRPGRIARTFSAFVRVAVVAVILWGITPFAVDMLTGGEVSNENISAWYNGDFSQVHLNEFEAFHTNAEGDPLKSKTVTLCFKNEEDMTFPLSRYTYFPLFDIYSFETGNKDFELARGGQVIFREDGGSALEWFPW